MARMAYLTLPLLIACNTVSSVHSAIPRGATVGDPRIIGTWAGPYETEKDDSTHLVISLVVPGRYELVNMSDESRSSLRFTRMGNWLLAEVSALPTRSQSETGWGLDLHYHGVIELTDSVVRLAWFDEDSLSAVLRASKEPLLEFFGWEGNLVLTSGSDSLAAGLAAYARQPGILTKWTTWRRVTHGTGR